MSGIHFSFVQGFFFLWTIPLVIGFFVYEQIQRKKALDAFADAAIIQKINSFIIPARRRQKLYLFSLAVIFMTIGLARPGWNPKPQQIQSYGRDVVFIVDVSKSMLAADLAPNRLERAKLAIIDTVDRLQGDRVALIAFAGTSVVKCPLTLDYGFFRYMVDTISVNSVSRGGTLIGDAVRKAMDDVFQDKEKRFKDIILITDGEDHDSFPVQAAEDAGNRGVRIITIGLGDENEAQRIPLEGGGFLTTKNENGQELEVLTKLDADTLTQMANVTGGRYLPVGTNNFDLGSIYIKLVASAEKKEMESRTIKRYEEQFQVFLIIALLLLVAETMLNERAKRSAT
ncbi:MAG: VWA domain-containing protein [Spirochaetales bacterium]|nr:VWA domain-containing protein [Spirochaetales bacterium]